MVLPLLGAIAPFAPLIGGAISAIGSLFAPKPKPVKNSIDLKGLRKDAEAAGFNPLTIIRNGGLGGYGVTPAAPDTRMANAFHTFGSAVSSWSYDPHAEKRAEYEFALAEAQLKQFATQGAPANMSLQVPSSTGPTKMADELLFKPIPQSGMEPGNITMMPGGFIVTNPGLAGDMQGHYGEAVGDLAGMEAYVKDQAWNALARPGTYNGQPSKYFTGGGF